MPIWLEAVLGLLAITPCVAACWREDALVAWEDRVVSANKIKRRKEVKDHDKRKLW